MSWPKHFVQEFLEIISNLPLLFRTPATKYDT